MKRVVTNLFFVVVIPLLFVNCFGGDTTYDSSYRKNELHHYKSSDPSTYKGSIEQQKDLEMLDKWEREDPESFYVL